jgi:hypothetical protein
MIRRFRCHCDCDHMKFLVSIDRDEDGMWVVECPSIPGCVSQGLTRESLDEHSRRDLVVS